MALNAEERYRQAEYEKNKESKELTKEDRINEAIGMYKRGERMEGVTLDTIISIMER